MSVSSVYPGAIPSYTTKVDGIDLVDDDHINQIQVDVVAIATELGVDPGGSCADLVARLTVSIADDGACQKGTSFPGSPVAGQFFFRTDEDVAYVRNAANDAWLSLMESNFSTGSNLEAAADTEQTESGSSYVKVKEISIAKGGTVNVNFQLKGSIGSEPVYGWVYKNGVAAGTERSVSSTSYSNFAEDISVSAGDLIQLYIKSPYSDDAITNNFRIKVSQPTTTVIMVD